MEVSSMAGTERAPHDMASLFEDVYRKLRELAEQRFRRGSPGATLQPTALVHEVYLRLAQQDGAAVHDREHLLAVAALAMRQILIYQARRRHAGKRGGDWARVTLGDVIAPQQDAAVDLLALDRVLTELSGLHPRQARIVELRVFADLTVPEVARVLGVSTATVEKDWRQARAWLRVQLARAR
jgi:RNA polymerase sigma-70 factor (ECF subfamily)